MSNESSNHGEGEVETSLLPPNLLKESPLVDRAKGNYLYLDNGQAILDATGGPAVACIGHGNERVISAIKDQIDRFSYCQSLFWRNRPAELLARQLVDSTGGQLCKAIIYGSGSEAVEAAMKLARAHYLNISQPTRSHFIARHGSFHGTTLGALSLTGFENARKGFEPLLNDNVSFVSACHPYRGRETGETDEDYCARLAKELDDEFSRVGKDRVCAFIAETMSGSFLGCVPPVPGYFRAMKAVCDKHGALLILDEIMCGMGRTGIVHAWGSEGIVPDIQVVAKGLGGGYAPISALLMHQKILDAIKNGPNSFNHGHTYQAHSVGCAAALEVQRVISSESLVENVATMGKRLEDGLKASLSHHPHIGDIRGRGLLWAIEFVTNKITKEPFPAGERIAASVRQLGLEAHHSISMQASGGSLDGRGDHIIISPAYNVTGEEVDLIVSKATKVITEFFKER